MEHSLRAEAFFLVFADGGQEISIHGRGLFSAVSEHQEKSLC